MNIPQQLTPIEPLEWQFTENIFPMIPLPVGYCDTGILTKQEGRRAGIVELLDHKRQIQIVARTD